MKTKWFDTKEIRDEESLSEDQIKYLKEGSITVFGPFNVLVRKQWDLLFTPIILGLVLGLSYGLLLPPYIVTPNQEDSNYYLYQLITDLPSALIMLAVFGTFGFKHGRRLAWNRNKWESFADFQKSENKWNIWGYIAIGFLFLKPLLELLFIAGSFAK